MQASIALPLGGIYPSRNSKSGLGNEIKILMFEWFVPPL